MCAFVYVVDMFSGFHSDIKHLFGPRNLPTLRIRYALRYGFQSPTIVHRPAVSRYPTALHYATSSTIVSTAITGHNTTLVMVRYGEPLMDHIHVGYRNPMLCILGALKCE